MVKPPIVTRKFWVQSPVVAPALFRDSLIGKALGCYPIEWGFDALSLSHFYSRIMAADVLQVQPLTPQWTELSQSGGPEGRAPFKEKQMPYNVMQTNGFPVKIWSDYVKSSALLQLHNLATLPFIHKHIAVMPDVHAGIGSTVGTVIPTKKAIIPSAVGVDIGCGMCAVRTNLTASDLPESLKSIREAIELAIPVGFSAYEETALTFEEDFSLRAHIIDELMKKHNIHEPKQGLHNQCGTLGGGNHFIELCLDEEQNVWIMLHSGSRGIGNAIGRKFIELARKEMEIHFINLPDKDLAYLPEGTEYFNDYWTALDWAQNYAAVNRKVMLRRIMSVLQKYFPSLDLKVTEKAINCHHNYAQKEAHYGENIYVTRKGAVRAREGDMGIIPGSMGAKSFIVRGLGNKESFCSCSHGAGRVMSRTEAKRVLTIEDHKKATEGVECRKDEGVLDETPAAYKDIDKVMEHQSDLVEIVATLKQVLCVKG